MAISETHIQMYMHWTEAIGTPFIDWEIQILTIRDPVLTGGSVNYHKILILICGNKNLRACEEGVYSTHLRCNDDPSAFSAGIDRILTCKNTNKFEFLKINLATKGTANDEAFEIFESHGTLVSVRILRTNRLWTTGANAPPRPEVLHISSTISKRWFEKYEHHIVLDDCFQKAIS